MVKNNKHLIIFLLHLIIGSCSSFSLLLPTHHVKHHQNHHPITTTTTILHAKQKKKKKATRNSIGNRTKSASGFGGAAISPCPCGSQNGYMKCCGLLHSSPKAYGNAKAEQVVRARYSAYAKREVCL